MVRERARAELSDAQRVVVDAFIDGACVRRPSNERKEAEGLTYHKGWEVRFYATSEADAHRVMEQLAEAGLRPGHPFHKHRRRWIVPLYGRRPVEDVLRWVSVVSE